MIQGFRNGAASPITSASINTAFLEPAMEARALNLSQYDPSAAVDSSLERIRALALRLPPSSEREELLLEVEETIASNVLEASAELSLCGDADRLVTDLRGAELGRIRQVLGTKTIARRLRKPLDDLLDDDSIGRRQFEAHAVIRATIAEVPRLMLLSDAVAHELGNEKFALLLDLTEKSGAAVVETADAAKAERGTARHGAL